MLIGTPRMVVREPFYREVLDVLDEVGPLEDRSAPTPGLVGSTIMGTRQLDDFLDRHGRIEEQLCEGAESVRDQQRLLEGRNW